jgi:hypothetical protein
MTAPLWFLSSFAPLWFMLGLRFERWWLEAPCFAAAAGGFALVFYLLHRRASELPSDSELRISGDGGSDVTGYLASFLLPFLTVARPDVRDLAAYVTFIAVLAVVYVRSDMVQINSVVYLLRWRVQRATLSTGDSRTEVFVITRSDRRVGEPLRAERFSDRVYIDHAPRS